MDRTLPNLVQTPIKDSKSKEYPGKAKGMSFFAFILSIFIYITVFYIFNLSPSNLYNNSKFWFFISNTLVIIIALDYGAFSSSKPNIYKHDHYFCHDNIMRRHQEIIKIYPTEDAEELQEKGVVTEKKVRTPDRRLSGSFKEMVPRSLRKNSQGKRLESALKRYNSEPDNDYQKNGVDKIMLHRSKSEIVKRVVFDESKNIIRLVERLDHDDDGVDEQNEYANLSNEELNKRVEEFIERFNRQIRLQGQVSSKVQ